MASASIEARDGGRWRVRWKEKADGAWRSRERTIHGSRTDAEDYRVRVVRALEDSGTFNIKRDEAQHRGPASLLDGLLAYIKARHDRGKIGDKTKRESERKVIALGEAICTATGHPEDEAIPVTVLSRPLFDSLVPILAKRGTSVAPQSLSLLHAAWCWMAADPTTYPHVPTAPRDPSDYVPPERVLGATVAPTLADCDAALRRLSRRVESSGRKGNPDTIVFALLLRYTGLRRSQVYSARVEDLDVANRTLVIRTGKSKKEKADQRCIPVSRHFFGEPAAKVWLSERLPLREPGDRLLTVRCVDTTVRAAWEDATALDKVPEHVWNPPQRDYARPDHAFRAAFQAAMEEEDVRDSVIDWLVGHHARTTRARHYGRDLTADGREAVDNLPAVDWIGPVEPEGSNVVKLRSTAR